MLRRHSPLLLLIFQLASFLPTTNSTPLAPLAFAAKGFGKKESSSIPVLSNTAKKLLKKHKNDVDAASTDYFQSRMKKISGTKEESHEVRVAETWNTVAAFMPLDYARSKGKVEPEVERRMRFIAAACGEEKVGVLLDVGCGDAALLSFLRERVTSSDEVKYRGIDLSSEMIALAKQKCDHMKSSCFVVGNFPEDVPKLDIVNEKGYRTVLFNGSLQFFRDTEKTVKEASDMLLPGGRVVISHVNGGAFVKDECRKIPSVAVGNMPNNISLQMMAQNLGLKVLDKPQLLADCKYDKELDGDQDKFYLVALEKPSSA